MNALLDLKECKEYITITLEDRNFNIKLAGTMKQPYFCGRDVCDVLDHKDFKYALKTHVSLKYKKELSSFYGLSNQDLGGGIPPPQTIVREHHNFLGKPQCTFREGQVIYISESGLYSLIMNSKTSFATLFQELVYETILPTIREYGSYQVESQLSQVMEQLTIKEQSEQQLKEKLVKAERKAIRVNKFMRRITVKEKKMEWIYLATTRVYAGERLFKVGSTIRLSSRIGGYNTGRPSEDSYYYCWVKKCYNAKDLDYHIQKLLSDFKHKENTELYCGIKFSDLQAIINFIVDNYDKSIDYINNFITTRLNESLEEEDEEPPRLDYKKITYQIGDHTETIDLEKEDSSVISDELDNILTLIKEQHKRPDILTIDRKELIDRLVKVTNLSKKDLWGHIKEYTRWKDSKTEIDDGAFKYKITY